MNKKQKPEKRIRPNENNKKVELFHFTLVVEEKTVMALSRYSDSNCSAKFIFPRKKSSKQARERTQMSMSL
jgi:hypothetical protein